MRRVWFHIAVAALVAVVSACRLAAPRPVTAVNASGRLPPPDPGGDPVECRGDACYQLGQRVNFIQRGRGFTLQTQRACHEFGLQPNRSSGPSRNYMGQPISDPAPGAPPTAQTFVCGPPGVNLVP